MENHRDTPDQRNFQESMRHDELLFLRDEYDKHIKALNSIIDWMDGEYDPHRGCGVAVEIAKRALGK